MNLNEYQAHAARTANTKLNPRERIIQAAFGLTGETGEVTDILKKILFHSHDFDRADLIKETGDVMWYLAELCSAWGITLDEVAQTNIAKLRARYPVAFDEERSRNRDETKPVTIDDAYAKSRIYTILDTLPEAERLRKMFGDLSEAERTAVVDAVNAEIQLRQAGAHE